MAFLEDRIKSQPVDLVVPVGGAGVQFAARHRERLFPDTPVLLLAPEPRMVPPGFLQTNATLVTQKVNLPGMVEDILQLQPQTTNIVVVFGASALEKFWVKECRREFQSFTNRVGFTWLDDLSLEQILERCAALPPHSFILNPLFVVDAAGIACEKNEALRRLHKDANAPLFGYFESELGLGPIGGRLYQDTEVGAQGARTAIRILHGESPGNIPPLVFESPTPAYDWRELQRWRIPEARLPSGSIIQFRQPGFWELYRWLIIGTILFCLLQAALIVSLLVNRAKRLHGEAEATLIADISSKFVNLPPGEVDREITAAERRIGEFLDLDLLALWQWSPGNPGAFVLTHLYSAQPGLQPGAQMSEDDFPWFREQMLAGRIVAIASLKELPAAANRDREKSRQLGVKSNLTIPLTVGGGPPIGILGLNTLRKERQWPDALVKRLQLVAQIFTNALARKRADQDMRESEQRMTLAAEAAEFGVWGWNIVRNEVWGSERWLRLFAFTSGEVICFEKVIQRIHPDDRATVEREVRRAMEDGSNYAGEFRAVLPDGTQRWIASRGRTQPDANGTPNRMLGAAIDITARRQAENEALRQRAELAHVARVSTMGELAASVAHELNQPLGAILANAEAAELFLNQNPPALDELHLILADIRKDDERAGEVIRRMRSLLSKHELQREPLQVNSLVEDVLQLVSGDATLRGMSLTADLAPVLPKVAGDFVHLQQVLLNLILNGMDAMTDQPRERRRISVQTRLGVDNQVALAVIDSGPGIAPEKLPRIFEAFYTTKPNGMGMGLSISRSIIEAHHGRIWAEANKSGGATFRISLPAIVEGTKP